MWLVRTMQYALPLLPVVSRGLKPKVSGEGLTVYRLLKVGPRGPGF